jgi:hypothetical protein
MTASRVPPSAAIPGDRPPTAAANAGRSGGRALTVALFGIVLLGLAALAALSVAADGLPYEVGGWPLFLVVAGCYGLVGAMVASRRPRNSVGWLLFGVGTAIGLALTCVPYADLSLVYASGALPLTSVAAWISSWGPEPAITAAILLLPIVFPTGTPLTRRWRRVAMALGCMVVTLTVYMMLRPGPLDGFPTITNPVGVEALGGDGLKALANVAPVFGLPLCVAAAVVRYRRGGPVERLQLRWFGFGVLLTVVLIVGAVVLPPPFRDWSWVLAWPSLGLIPLAIGIAILRYHLFDIDRLVSRTLGWAISTGAVVAVFGVGLVLLQAALAGLTQGATLAVAASTLLAFAAFQPLRRRIQRAVDRRFDRARYDAERTATGFADRLRDEVELDAVAGELTATVGRALRPTGTAVWLRQGK